MTMRLCVIGHSYVTAFAQAKYVAMREQAPDMALRLITPQEIEHTFMRYRPELAPGLRPEEVIAIRGLFGRSNVTYTLDPFELAHALKAFAPDHIHIEEDPYSLVGVQTVLLSRLFCRNATISFFIWDNLNRNPGFPLNMTKKVLGRFSLSRASLVVCGNQEGQQLLASAKGYRGRSLVLPQVGLDQDDYAGPPPEVPSQTWFEQRDVPVIGFLGRLVPEKGLLLLLEALARLEHLPWKLLIVGSGPLKDELQAWQARFEDRLLCVDAVPHRLMPGYLKRLDVFVLPSYRTERWKEQFGLTLAQAMMAGVACVGSSSGAIPEVMGPGGLVFQEGNVTELSEVLERLLRTKAERDRLKQAGQSFALARYSNRAVAKAYLAAFGELYPDTLSEYQPC